MTLSVKLKYMSPRRAIFAAAMALPGLILAQPLHAQSESDRPRLEDIIRLPVPRPGPQEIMQGAISEAGIPDAASSASDPGLPATPGLDDDIPDEDFVLTLRARLDDQSPDIVSGITWRIFEPLTDPEKEPDLIVEKENGPIAETLPAGTYVVQASFGLANLVKLVDLRYGPKEEVLTFDAGGMLLRASVGDDRLLTPEEVSFSIFVSDPITGVRTLLARDIQPDRLIRLAADTYHVVSQYGGANSIRRADVRVQPGKLTEATIVQRAAEITLKLVAETGGEALANTQWTVLTPGGDVVSELIGAFPTIILAEGEYTAIARQNKETFMREFSVETALDREIEVLARN